MLGPVKILPNGFLVTSEPADSRAPEVPPEVSMGHIPLKNQRTAEDGT